MHLILFLSQTPVWRCLVRITSSRILFFLCIALVFGSQLLRAEVTAGVLGTFVDPSGANVANASLTLPNHNTGQVRHAHTNPSGNFEFLGVRSEKTILS